MKEEFEVKAGWNWRWFSQSLYGNEGYEINLSRKLSNKLQFKRGNKVKVLITDEEIKDNENQYKIKASRRFLGQVIYNKKIEILLSRKLANKLQIAKGKELNAVLNKME